MKKAIIGIPLGIIFVLIFIVIIGSIIVSFSLLSGGKGPVTEVVSKRNIYLDINALRAAKIYMETSLDYSVYQAVYDNGLKGGWNKIPKDRLVSIDGKDYAYWGSRNEKKYLSLEELNASLASSILENLNKYTSSKYRFFTEVEPVTLPEYKTGKINVTIFGDLFKVTAKGEENLVLKDRSLEYGQIEIIELEESSRVENFYNISYFTGLYSNALSMFGGLVNLPCDDSWIKGRKIMENEKMGDDFLLNVTVVDKESGPCKAFLKVDMIDTKTKMPVYNGTAVSFEHPGISYAVKLD